MDQKDRDFLKEIHEVVEGSKAQMRAFLMEKSKADRFKILREDLSIKAIEEICEWAIPEEDYEICATVAEVKANNIDEFPITFPFEGKDGNVASVVKFIKEDGVTYYHADIQLDEGEEESIINLFKRSDGSWHSEWKSNDSRFFQPLGEAIDLHELQT